MDIIQRNIERLIYLDDPADREAIEVAGMLAYADDFMLQPSPALRDKLLALGGEKNPERLERYELAMERAKGTLHKLKPQSVKAYASDLLHTIRNIEE